jgi:wyosine [tRNA(Phe)-imidazoG37] synthetase (radical SAM superfamily)
MSCSSLSTSSYVFGPVPSRRLGQSLGIDLIPMKTCNWNCVYCQLGQTPRLVHDRRSYTPPQDILAQLDQVLASHRPGTIDWISFVGSGEPTLHQEIGNLIQAVKARYDLPVSVITNGSLLYLPAVHDALLPADAVLPTLNAGTAALYKGICRPHPTAYFDRHLRGLIDFRRAYGGHFWVEVMLVRGLNDTENALNDLATAIERIDPDEVHLMLPTRAPSELWVKPSNEEGLMRATALLSRVARVVHPAGGSFALADTKHPAETILGIITRHPMREEELVHTLEAAAPDRAADILSEILGSGRARVVERFGTRFWMADP